MKIAVCYTAVANGTKTEDFAARFIVTYRAFPPGIEHDTFIISNGGVLRTGAALIFAPISPRMFPRSNSGWDIGGYFEAARGPCSGYDMMVCLGESVHFQQAGWLKRLVDVWNKVGPGMYGPFASYVVRAHLGTTAFCCAPTMFKRYPFLVENKAQRYEFEHGQGAFWRRLSQFNIPTRLVTWDGDWGPREWRKPPNILWRGDQSNCLMLCSHTERYENADAERKVKWARSADRPFK